MSQVVAGTVATGTAPVQRRHLPAEPPIGNSMSARFGETEWEAREVFYIT